MKVIADTELVGALLPAGGRGTHPTSTVPIRRLRPQIALLSLLGQLKACVLAIQTPAEIGLRAPRRGAIDGRIAQWAQRKRRRATLCAMGLEKEAVGHSFFGRPWALALQLYGHPSPFLRQDSF